MTLPIIAGIQQVGIGIPDVHEAWGWYRRNFGMDIPIFEEAADAELMLPYTGGKPRSRHAILALNLQGGGGMEIWQYTSRTPEGPKTPLQVGDLGIYGTRIKCLDVPGALTQFQAAGLDLQGKIQNDPSGNPFCWVKDPYGNLFQVIQSDSWFTKDKYLTGGPSGCIIGSSDIEAARKLYSDLLGYDQVVYDKSGMFSDFSPLPGGKQKYRRVLLTHSKARQGGFSRVFGQTHIELIQALDRTPNKIFEGRMWGDLGFIHLCFDIVGMDELRESCAEKGFPFTIDSATTMGKEFDMGEAAGLFSYIEDPDGTLIEFVQTYKLPLLKKLGWYLDMRKRDPAKPLPNWMMKALRFNRVKD